MFAFDMIYCEWEEGRESKSIYTQVDGMSYEAAKT